jgi:hypothetical protein
MTKKSGEGWDARMGWRFVSYGEQGLWLSFQIEPMAKGPDIVYVPDESVWSQGAPSWAEERRDEIMGRLESVPWNRKLTWEVSAKGGVTPARKPDEPVPHSLESTPVGRLLERLRLFEPGGMSSHDFSHKLWHWAARKFAATARGQVNLFIEGEPIPDSVFQAVELPALQANPHVTLNIRRFGGKDAVK